MNTDCPPRFLQELWRNISRYGLNEGNIKFFWAAREQFEVHPTWLDQLDELCKDIKMKCAHCNNNSEGRYGNWDGICKSKECFKKHYGWDYDRIYPPSNTD